MHIIPETNADLIRKLTLTSTDVAAFLRYFLPMLPHNMDDKNRQLLREGLGKLLTIGVKEQTRNKSGSHNVPSRKHDYHQVLDVLNTIETVTLKVKYARQRGVPVEVKRDMDVISTRWDTLRRRALVAQELFQYQNREEITSAELARRLEIRSTGYLTYLMTLRRSVTSRDLAERIEKLTGLPVDAFLVASRGGYKPNNASKDMYAELLGRRRVRQIILELQHLDDKHLETILTLVRGLANKEKHLADGAALS